MVNAARLDIHFARLPYISRPLGWHFSSISPFNLTDAVAAAFTGIFVEWSLRTCSSSRGNRVRAFKIDCANLLMTGYSISRDEYQLSQARSVISKP